MQLGAQAAAAAQSRKKKYRHLESCPWLPPDYFSQNYMLNLNQAGGAHMRYAMKIDKYYTQVLHNFACTPQAYYREQRHGCQ